MSDRASVGESVGESVGQPDQELLEEIIQRRRNFQFPSRFPNSLMSQL
jgi:serine phosphatase RsbU (regulator of sigma subunit)